MQMPPTTITIPNNTTLPQKEDAMATNAAANNEISPTGVDAFDSHFNFNNDNNNNNNTNDAIIDKSTSYHDHQHNHPSSLITSSYPTTIVQQHVPIITSNIFSTTSPLLEQHPIQIQVAAMEFIQTPTNNNWKYLVHLFRVERRKKEEEEQYQQQQRMQHRDDPSLEAEEQQEEDQRDDVVLDYVATMPDEGLGKSLEIEVFDVAYDNEKDDSTEHEEEVDDEQSVDNDSDVQEESVNSIKDETKVVEQVSVDSNNEEEEEEGQEVTITEEEPINGVEEEGQEVTIKEAERINDAQEKATTTTTTLINHSTSSNKSSSTTTSNKSSTAAMLTGRNGSNKYDHRDWMAAFRLIYQLLWLSKAWVELTAFVNRFCTRRR